VQNTDLYRQNYRAPDTIRHSGIQPHSMGSLFPAVIAVVENYERFPEFTDWFKTQCRGLTDWSRERTAFYAQSLDARLRYRAWELNFPGEEPQLYSSREDAEQAACALILQRDRMAAPFTQEEVEQGVAAAEEMFYAGDETVERFGHESQGFAAAERDVRSRVLAGVRIG
jgi:hypothetical protein